MMTSAQKRAKEKYHAEKCDHFSFWTKRGKKEKFKQAAEKLGLSFAGFMTLAGERLAQAAFCGEVPIIYSEDAETAQNQPNSTQVQTIQPATENAPQRITGNEMRLIEAVKTLTPETQKALLKFLETLQG